MLDPIVLEVREISKFKEFYLRTLKPLGFSLSKETEQSVIIVGPDGQQIEAISRNFGSTKRDASAQMVIVNHRKLKDGKTYQDFHQAWLPPVTNSAEGSPMGYFQGSVKVYNACDITDPTDVLTIALLSGDINDVQKESIRLSETEKLRSERVKQVADKVDETKIYQIMNIDELGS